MIASSDRFCRLFFPGEICLPRSVGEDEGECIVIFHLNYFGIFLPTLKPYQCKSALFFVVEKGYSSFWRVFLEKRCIFGEGSSGRSSSEEICVISMVLDGKGQWVGLSVVFIP
jgi:hypothetical protein